MYEWLIIVVISLLAERTLADTNLPSPDGNAVIRGRAGPSDIVITTTDRVAGTIHSLTWNGKEFIDSTDHGRQLQSAASFNCAKAGDFWPECYNPTEAGSRRPGRASLARGFGDPQRLTRDGCLFSRSAIAWL